MRSSIGRVLPASRRLPSGQAAAVLALPSLPASPPASPLRTSLPCHPPLPSSPLRPPLSRSSARSPLPLSSASPPSSPLSYFLRPHLPASARWYRFRARAVPNWAQSVPNWELSVRIWAFAVRIWTEGGRARPPSRGPRMRFL
eukprot:2509110-Rhodomonas_salina.3